MKIETKFIIAGLVASLLFLICFAVVGAATLTVYAAEPAGRIESDTVPVGTPVSDALFVHEEFKITSAPFSFLDRGTGPITVSPKFDTGSLVFTVQSKNSYSDPSTTVKISNFIWLSANSISTIDLQGFGKLVVHCPVAKLSSDKSVHIQAIADLLNGMNLQIVPDDGGDPSDDSSTPPVSSGDPSSADHSGGPSDPSAGPSSLPQPGSTSQDTADRPFLDTPLNDYNVTEGLLLVTVILLSFSALVAVIRGR